MARSDKLWLSTILCYFSHLYAPYTMFSSKFTSIFEPADAWHGSAHGRATKLNCVACRNSIQLLLHTLGVCPIGTWVEENPIWLVRRFWRSLEDVELLVLKYWWTNAKTHLWKCKPGHFQPMSPPNHCPHHRLLTPSSLNTWQKNTE